MSTRQVFISWSGTMSNKIGKVIRDWLPTVLQFVNPYFTPSDLEKGARWSNEVALELENSQIGILCITRESLDSSWLLFEAGSLSNKLGKSCVCPVLFGMSNRDLRDPLSQFQTTEFNKKDMLKLVKTINAQSKDNKLSDEVLIIVFEKFWPDIETKVKKIVDEHVDPEVEPVRSDSEILGEVLGIVRVLQKKTERNSSNISDKAITHMLERLIEIHNLVRHHATDDGIMDKLRELRESVSYIVSRIGVNRGLSVDSLAKYNDLLYECISTDDIPF